jgi:hypothetical protein
VFEARLADEANYSREVFSFKNAEVDTYNQVKWVPLAQFLRGEAELFPAAGNPKSSERGMT